MSLRALDFSGSSQLPWKEVFPSPVWAQEEGHRHADRWTQEDLASPLSSRIKWHSLDFAFSVGIPAKLCLAFFSSEGKSPVFCWGRGGRDSKGLTASNANFPPSPSLSSEVLLPASSFSGLLDFYGINQLASWHTVSPTWDFWFLACSSLGQGPELLSLHSCWTILSLLMVSSTSECLQFLLIWVYREADARMVLDTPEDIRHIQTSTCHIPWWHVWLLVKSLFSSLARKCSERDQVGCPSLAQSTSTARSRLSIYMHGLNE